MANRKRKVSQGLQYDKDYTQMMYSYLGLAKHHQQWRISQTMACRGTYELEKSLRSSYS